MKKLIFLLSIILSITIIGCTPTNKDQPKQTANYKNVIKHLYNQNSSKISMINKAMVDNGYKDTMILNAAVEVMHNSDAMINKHQSLDKNYAYLLEKYKIVVDKDTACFNRAHVFLEQFNENKDSVNYYNYLLNALVLESDILDFYCAQLGASRITYYTMIFKEADTVRANDVYSFVIIPADYSYRHSEVIVDSLIEITVDDKKIHLPVQIKQTGGAVTFTLTPTQKGKYFIKGKISVTHKISKLITEDSYSNLFYVK